jgi:hypothetical protein
MILLYNRVKNRVHDESKRRLSSLIIDPLQIPTPNQHQDELNIISAAHLHTISSLPKQAIQPVVKRDQPNSTDLLLLPQTFPVAGMLLPPPSGDF